MAAVFELLPDKHFALLKSSSYLGHTNLSFSFSDNLVSNFDQDGR